MKQKILIIDASSKFNKFIKYSNEENTAKDEINSFINEFKKDIQNNKFIEYTIRSIICYLIRRYFYPTNYFNNLSFFKFKQSFDYSKEQEMKKVLGEAFYSNNEYQFSNNLIKFSSLMNDYKTNTEDKIKTIQYQEFEETDFIKLRTLNTNGKDFFYLVIHIDSFYIFIMKKAFVIDDNSHEKYFCEHFSHHCITKFYGFVKSNGEKVGYIYEFLSNGSLLSLIEKRIKPINDLYLLTLIIRLFLGIDYLHSNSLIHRDIKPLNILIDYDYVPFLSDFDTIRHIYNGNNETMTNDIGSFLYSSPEQDMGENLSTSTDIYSFGLILYYLFEKKDMVSFQDQSKYSKKENDEIPLISNASKNIQFIHQSCLQFDPEKRMKNDEIRTRLIVEINSFLYKKQYLSCEKEPFVIENIINFLIECIFIQINDPKGLNSLYLNINEIKNEYELSNRRIDSDSLIKLGNIYYYGLGANKNYFNAKKYYELSANQNNPRGLFKLGKLYCEGKGVTKDYLVGKKYLELSAKENDKDALFYLGSLYLHGFGVEKNYIKAIKYYELSAEQNNQNALYNLGLIFLNGDGVKQDYFKAKIYFEKCADLGNSKAFLELGNLYLYGHGVEKNYNKAKYYYDISASNGNSNALANLGYLYFNGYDVKKDYSKAKDFLERSASKGNSKALLNLGHIYKYGYGVERNYKMAFNYYFQSAQKNDSDAQNELGDFYLKGFGVKKNYSIAKEYYQSSAMKNNVNAIISLGILYERGLGVKQDYLMAKKYYDSAASYNDSTAFYNLGNLFENGLGVNQNYSKAI